MEVKTTPMMQQWQACKAQAKDALLLFRLGDFYEAFHEDAAILSRDLELTLTKRGDIPMSGIPAHTLENYLEKLINKGHLVAIAEQVEDPKSVKGIVKREIVRLLSPGAVYSPSLLSDKSNNFFGCICLVNSRFGLAMLDLTTADFKTIEVDTLDQLKEEVFRLNPSELLISEKFTKLYPEFITALQDNLLLRLTIKPDWHFDLQNCHQFLIHHFKVHNLDGFGLKGLTSAINAAGTLLSHIQEDLSLAIDHVNSLETYHLGSYMLIDQTTQKHLEIFSSQNSKKSQNTLLHLLDQTLTPMGGRLLRQWISHPLLSKEAIDARLDATEELLNFSSLPSLAESLREIRDLERLMMRISTGYSTPRDLIALRSSLETIPSISNSLTLLKHPLFQEIKNSISDTTALVDKIKTTLVEDPPLRVSDGHLIKPNVHQELDLLKELKTNSETFLVQYQEKLKQETGIKTLKVGFNKAFGYFIEISRGQAGKVPPYFHKRQTLINNERFITEELREYENKILNAEETISKIEITLYNELRAFVASFENPVRAIAKGIAHLDCLLSFCKIAQKRHYTRPVIDISETLSIKEGRHPIIEASDLTSSFIPNDTEMNGFDQKLFVITGPNMAGKSTYIRQVALICIMAQLGCFVPAKSAHIGIIDKIFSRIGASDDLSRGQSTFMVEMTETANILRHATKKSLVILDEIGRGTSTYDGISIAWSVAEYLLTHPQKCAKTLFATHYCELTELQERFPGAVNYNIAVKETSQGIVFLRKIVPGGTDKSYGIHVAKLAGLPSEVILKATEMLSSLENKGIKTFSKKIFTKKDSDQLLLFAPPTKDLLSEKLVAELKEINLHHITPMQALSLLEKFKSYFN